MEAKAKLTAAMQQVNADLQLVMQLPEHPYSRRMADAASNLDDSVRSLSTAATDYDCAARLKIVMQNAAEFRKILAVEYKSHCADWTRDKARHAYARLVSNGGMIRSLAQQLNAALLDADAASDWRAALAPPPANDCPGTTRTDSNAPAGYFRLREVDYDSA